MVQILHSAHLVSVDSQLQLGWHLVGGFIHAVLSALSTRSLLHLIQVPLSSHSAQVKSHSFIGSQNSGTRVLEKNPPEQMQFSPSGVNEFNGQIF